MIFPTDHHTVLLVSAGQAHVYMAVLNLEDMRSILTIEVARTKTLAKRAIHGLP